MLSLVLLVLDAAVEFVPPPPFHPVFTHTAATAVSHELLAALRFCGVLSVGVIAVSMAMLLMYLGACNALPPSINCCPVHHAEPVPRAVRWTYPEEIEPRHRHWFLLHVAQTRLLKEMSAPSLPPPSHPTPTPSPPLCTLATPNHHLPADSSSPPPPSLRCVVRYVASISQYVGARGTSGAKLMLMSCTAVAICQMQTAWMLWRIHALITGEEPMTRCLLMWAGAISLMILGLAESALDWQTSVKRKKEDPDDGPEHTGMAHTGTSTHHLPTPDSPSDYDAKKNGDRDATLTKPPPLKRLMSVYTEEDEAQGKRVLRLAHMLAAFAVVGFNVAAQWVGPHPESRVGSMITVSIGLVAFLVFCAMQWLSGANDDFIPDSLGPFKASAVAYSFCACLRSCCYCPVSPPPPPLHCSQTLPAVALS